MIKMKMLIGGHSASHRLLALLNSEIKNEIILTKNSSLNWIEKTYIFLSVWR